MMQTFGGQGRVNVSSQKSLEWDVALYRVVHQIVHFLLIQITSQEKPPDTKGKSQPLVNKL